MSNEFKIDDKVRRIGGLEPVTGVGTVVHKGVFVQFLEQGYWVIEDNLELIPENEWEPVPPDIEVRCVSFGKWEMRKR